jgi:hypothetical protein
MASKARAFSGLFRDDISTLVTESRKRQKNGNTAVTD